MPDFCMLKLSRPHFRYPIVPQFPHCFPFLLLFRVPCSRTCTLLLSLFHAIVPSVYCSSHVFRQFCSLPGDSSFDLLSPGKPSCISLCRYFAQYTSCLQPCLSSLAPVSLRKTLRRSCLSRLFLLIARHPVVTLGRNSSIGTSATTILNHIYPFWPLVPQLLHFCVVISAHKFTHHPGTLCRP